MANNRIVRVGSRTSPLALAQNEEVLSLLRPLYPGVEFKAVLITTTGDRNKDAPLLSMQRGMFVKEIELALLRGEIDMAVHSAKDLTADIPDGLAISAVAERQDPRDVQVNRWGVPIADLPEGARMGTSSPRRTAQLKAQRPDVEAVPIRGNVGTRLDKARSDDYDGVVLAAAGILRLGRESEIVEHLDTHKFTPEVGQGTLAAEFRADDDSTNEMLAAAVHDPTKVALIAERAFLATMGGGCQVPIAAYARPRGDEINVIAMAALPDGSSFYRIEVEHIATDPEAAGQTAAQRLLDAGAREIV